MAENDPLNIPEPLGGSKPKTALLDLDTADKRTRSYRRGIVRYEAIRGNVLADMGGEENTTEIQRQLISKFATLALQLEVLETAAIEGREVDIDLFGRCSAHLRRLGESLGIAHRASRDVTPPTLAQIAEELAREDEANNDEQA